jgi:hypothetical protein
MTQTKFVFSYTETRDFEEALEVTMEVPERSIDEMCEYFQRFLIATGYLFDEGEHIKPVKKEVVHPPGCGGDVITFNTDGTPHVYDFGGDTTLPDFWAGGGMKGGAGNDFIAL